MRLEEAIKHGKRKVKQGVFQVDPDALLALLLLIEAGKTVLEMRHHPFPDGVVKLPWETTE